MKALMAVGLCVLAMGCDDSGGSSGGSLAGSGGAGASSGAGSGGKPQGGTGQAGAPSGGSGGAGQGGAGPGGASGSNGGPGEAACQTYAKNICSRLAACDRVRLIGGYGDEATCTTRQVQACIAALALPDVQPIFMALPFCGATYKELSCPQVLAHTVPENCVFPGGRLDGAACGHSWQCLSGYCDLGGAACGYCASRQGEGGPCSDLDDCQNGLGCRDGACEPYVAEGEFCTKSSSLCAPGLACVGVLATASTCKALPTLGQTCDLSGQTAASSCASTAPARCDAASETCVAMTVVQPGGACNDFTGTTVCAAGFCDGSTCKAPRADGMACTSHLECAAPARCDGGVCGVGATCG